MSNKQKTKIYAFLAIIFWASSFVSTKIILNEHILSPLDLGVLRYFLASVILLPTVFIFKLKLPDKKYFLRFIISGIMGYSAYVFLFNTAITMISPSTSSVINAICPGLTAILAYFTFKEKISKFGIFSLLISFLGILILCLWGHNLSTNIGVIYMLFAAIFLSGYNISQRLYVRDYSPYEVMTYSILFGTAILVLIHPQSFLLIEKISFKIFSHIVFLAVFSSIISYYCWAKAMKICENTSEVTNFMFLTPVLATILSFIMFGYLPSFNTYLGGGLILLGMILFQRDKNTKKTLE